MTLTLESEGVRGDLLGLGVAHLLVGEAARAERLLRQAVRLAPGWAVANAYLGTALLARGKKRAARRALE
jgi:Flp pilus assembly protein TadD